jgi:hypothetical protein
MTRKQAMDAHCSGCGYDPFSSGTAKEQVALCVSVDCNLHPFRPMPRHCRKNGVIDKAAINAIAEKLDAAEARRVNR